MRPTARELLLAGALLFMIGIGTALFVWIVSPTARDKVQQWLYPAPTPPPRPVPPTPADQIGWRADHYLDEHGRTHVVHTYQLRGGGVRSSHPELVIRPEWKRVYSQSSSPKEAVHEELIPPPRRIAGSP